MARWILKIADTILNWIVILCLCTAGLYAGYALWDNSRIYTAANDVQADMLKMKPAVDADGGASFAELLAINADVCAWVSLEGTKIEYPVLQGSTNLTYINRDVYGNFALAGSIYLDTRNRRDFSDAYSLLYGHYMEKSGMFGDLELYKEESFFRNHSAGTLLLPDKSYTLEIFACLLTEAGEEAVFDPERWRTDVQGLLSYTEKNCLYLRQETLKKLEQRKEPKILALSTCSGEFTDARTIILAVMEPYQTANREEG